MTAITGLRIINQKSENAEDGRKAQEKREAKRRRMPLKATSKRLERVALHYLERYSSSSENLRRVLMRRVERSARAHGTDREEGAAAIDAIVTKFQEYGYLNDRAYAEMRAGSLFRRGSSLRVIRYQLCLKGITGDIVDAVIADLMEEEPDLDRRAAVAYGGAAILGRGVAIVETSFETAILRRWAGKDFRMISPGGSSRLKRRTNWKPLSMIRV